MAVAVETGSEFSFAAPAQLLFSGRSSNRPAQVLAATTSRATGGF